MGAIFEAPKQSENLEKSEKARQLDARLHPPVSLFPCIKGFLRGIRKKVPKLLYHSLGTNVVAGVGLEPHDLLVMSPVVVPPRPQSRRAATKSLLFQNSPMGVAPAEVPYLGGTLKGSLHHHGGPLKGSPLFYITSRRVSIKVTPSHLPHLPHLPHFPHLPHLPHLHRRLIHRRLIHRSRAAGQLTTHPPPSRGLPFSSGLL